MVRKNEKGTEYYIALEYPYIVTQNEDEFFVRFPDLPGCVTQVERAEDIHSLAQEIKVLWLETAIESNQYIPEPASDEYSGKFVVRVPKALHRDLVHQAKQEGMSLNSFVLHLLSSRSIQAGLENLVASAIASQPGVSHSSPRTRSSHRFLIGSGNPFSQDRSDRKGSTGVAMLIEERPIDSGYNFNPKTIFSS